MTRTRRLGLAVSLALLAGVAAVETHGQDAGPDDTSIDDRFGAMQEEIDRLRDDNSGLRVELDDLRAETRDDWLTEARAEEIRTLVAEVLADADVRASHLGSGMIAGWNDGFFLSSPDGRFRLEFDGLMQVRYILNYHDQVDRVRSGFEVTRARLTFRGHVFDPAIQWMIRMDKTRNDPGLVEGLYVLRDGWVRYRLNDDFSLRFGLYKAPFNREELVGPAYQQAVERSLVNENTNVGRTEGVELTYHGEQNKFIFSLDDGSQDNLGGFDVAGLQPPNTSALLEDVEWAFHTRYEHLFAGEWRQFRDFTSPPGEDFAFMVGAAFMMEQDELNGLGSQGKNENRWLAGTVDASAEWGGANLFGSFVWHYLDAPNFNLNAWGAVLQGGVYIQPKLEIFARWEYGSWDIDVASFVDLHTVTIGANYYIDGQDLKWMTDLGFGINRVDQNWDSDIAGWRIDGPDAAPQIVFRTQFQLMF